MLTAAYANKLATEARAEENRQKDVAADCIIEEMEKKIVEAAEKGEFHWIIPPQTAYDIETIGRFTYISEAFEDRGFKVEGNIIQW